MFIPCIDTVNVSCKHNFWMLWASSTMSVSNNKTWEFKCITIITLGKVLLHGGNCFWEGRNHDVLVAEIRLHDNFEINIAATVFTSFFFNLSSFYPAWSSFKLCRDITGQMYCSQVTCFWHHVTQFPSQPSYHWDIFPEAINVPSIHNSFV